MERNDIPVGTYRVAVETRLAAPVQKDPSEYFNEDGSTKIEEVKTSKIPEKYNVSATSGIQIDIKEGSQELKVDLDS